jgi:hypothetical protein
MQFVSKAYIYKNEYMYKKWLFYASFLCSPIHRMLSYQGCIKKLYIQEKLTILETLLPQGFFFVRVPEE